MNDLDKINIEETRAQGACLLNELWHSRLPNLHWSNVVRSGNYVCYVFKYKQAIIGVAIWSSPVAANRMKDGRLLLELRRLALSNVCPKNMASFVLSKMIQKIKIKFPNIIKVISYQDKEAHVGTIYKASNWVGIEQTKIAKGKLVTDWSKSSRKRKKSTNIAPKIRWEYKI